jgi:phosphoribosylaminoimidazolecarboxamide formyltransferase/IMP cyclohydrolase
MNLQPLKIKRALISVSDKTGIVELARELCAMNIEIISTGGTCQLLREAALPIREVSELTQFPEMMDGRVKTLHPKIHGGILGLRDQHQKIAKEHEIPWIDLVIVNLYPFAKTIQKSGVSFDEAIENIDIGGPTLIRSAAKNMGWTTVVVDPLDYETLLNQLRVHKELNFATRRELATKAFSHTAAYDALIQKYLQKEDSFPEELTLSLKKYADLRYGENPHQAACAYHFLPQTQSILTAKQHQGKLLSYNNISDGDAALACVSEFVEPACVIVKHANPCGVALAPTIEMAFQRALAADSQSAFGGIVALNRPCNKSIAEALGSVFMEVLIAPGYETEALSLLAQKPKLRVLEVDYSAKASNQKELKFIQGGLLIQEKDHYPLELDQLKVVTELKPERAQLETMLFAWRVLKHLKSNAILVAKDQVTVGVGTGQVSRIDAVDLALRKADSQLPNTILASDAFFPFRDSIDRIAQFSKSAAAGVSAIIQPGGSLKDAEVIQACNEHGISMVFTGQRCFKH